MDKYCNDYGCNLLFQFVGRWLFTSISLRLLSLRKAKGGGFLKTCWVRVSAMRIGRFLRITWRALKLWGWKVKINLDRSHWSETDDLNVSCLVMPLIRLTADIKTVSGYDLLRKKSSISLLFSKKSASSLQSLLSLNSCENGIELLQDSGWDDVYIRKLWLSVDL